MEDSLGHLFSGRVSGLPKWQRFDAATPTRDGCDLPYSLSDCCTRSHMNVLQNFSRDEAVRDDQWVLILEDDVALHESIAPHRLGQIINAGLLQAVRQMSGFMYMGLCSPTCKGPELELTPAKGAGVSFQGPCGGFCTHAYAVQKWVAGRVPEYLKSMNGKQRTIDQALNQMAFPLNMSLLGSSLRSRDIRSAGSVHAGIFYMKAFSDSLTTGDWEQKPKVVFRLLDWLGRIGNLMFEWASVVALAARAGAESQAHFVVTGHRDTPQCPAVSFFRHFRLQRFSRDASDIREIKPKCTLLFEETGPNVYSEDAVTKLINDIKAIEDGSTGKRCRLLEVYVQGYPQSYKYFQGHESLLRSALTPPPASKARADAWLQRLGKRLQEKSPGTKWFYVGVQVRRGDKVHTPAFNEIYEPTDWPYYRAGMQILQDRLTASTPDAKVAFVITAGGTMGNSASDAQETKQGLSAPDKVVVFVEGTDAYTDYALLTAMDAVVLSASSFGWWAGYLSKGGQADGLVVAPQYIYRPS